MTELPAVPLLAWPTFKCNVEAEQLPVSSSGILEVSDTVAMSRISAHGVGNFVPHSRILKTIFGAHAAAECGASRRLAMECSPLVGDPT